MLFFMDNVEIFKDLFAKTEAVRAEKPTAGTRFRLMGLLADIAAFTRSLQTQVLDVVCHEAVVDADADIDYALEHVGPVIRGLRELSPFGPGSDVTTYS